VANNRKKNKKKETRNWKGSKDFEKRELGAKRGSFEGDGDAKSNFNDPRRKKNHSREIEEENARNERKNNA